MDAHRLRSVLDLILAEHSRLGIDHKLAQIIQLLGAAISKRSHESDEKFKLTLTELMTALRRCRTNDMVESDRRILCEIQAERFTGNGLAERVLAIASERPFLAAMAKEQFVEVADELQSSLSACSAARVSFAKLNLERPVRSTQQYELGVLLPESLLRGDLERLLSELKEWNQVLHDLLPIFSAQPASVGLRCFSTHRFELSANLDAAGALALGTVIAAIYEMFGKVKANRERASELEREGYPAEIVGRLRDYEKQMVARELKTLKETVIASYRTSGSSRRRDVDRSLERCLRFLSVRIRDGVEVELVGPPPTTVDMAGGDVSFGPEPDRAITHHVREALLSARQTRPQAQPASAPAQEDDEPKAVHLPLSHMSDDQMPPRQAA